MLLPDVQLAQRLAQIRSEELVEAVEVLVSMGK
jgi:hypothetical protein